MQAASRFSLSLLRLALGMAVAGAGGRAMIAATAAGGLPLFPVPIQLPHNQRHDSQDGQADQERAAVRHQKLQHTDSLLWDRGVPPFGYAFTLVLRVLLSL